MERSQFCKQLLRPGLLCSCALGFRPEGLASILPGQSGNHSDPAETPCNGKVEFTQKWVKRFFEIVDQQLIEETRIKLMQIFHSGLSLAINSVQVKTGKK